MIRIVCLLIGYAFGLFQTAYIIGKLHGIDIREHGSGNSGTTNMLRTLGTRYGLLTFAGDCLKCVAAICLVRLLFGKSHADMLPLLVIYTAAGVILAHDFPFYLRFRGGKGIAATAGLVFSFDPIMTVLGLITFFGIFFITHYVSLGSVMVYVGIMIEMIVCNQYQVSKTGIIAVCIRINVNNLSLGRHNTQAPMSLIKKLRGRFRSFRKGRKALFLRRKE